MVPMARNRQLLDGEQDDNDLSTLESKKSPLHHHQSTQLWLPPGRSCRASSSLRLALAHNNRRMTCPWLTSRACSWRMTWSIHLQTGTLTTQSSCRPSSPSLRSSPQLTPPQHPGRLPSPCCPADNNNSTLFPGEDSSTSKAFFKGMEDASMLLPRFNVVLDGRGHKKRFDMDDMTEAGRGRGRSRTDSEEEDTAVKMLDRLILNGYDMYPGEMQEVLITLDKEKKTSQKSIRSRRRGGTRHTQTAVTDLDTLLIRCAEAVSRNDRRSASEVLERIKRYSSPRGDARQRLAHYFAQGLEARLAGTGSELYRSLVGKHTSTLELVQAYHLQMATCCFVNVASLFSNYTIYNAVAGRRKLHIVHYGVITGYKWPELIQWLADREGGPPEVRITAINNPQPGFRPAELIKEAGHRLSTCASKFGVPFKFHAVAAKLESVQAEDLHIDPDEVLVVHSLFQFRTMLDDNLTGDKVNPRDMVLNTIRKMKPSVFIHAVVNGSYSAAFFMTRFRQALYYFTALFDMMDTAIPRGNDKRMLVERYSLAWSAINMIACEGTDRVERPQNYREWQAQNQRAGLRQLPLDRDIVLSLKDEVKNKYHTHFMVYEDHRWVLQGWKRPSAMCPRDMDS